MRKLSAKNSKTGPKTKRSPIREDSFGLDIGLESLHTEVKPKKMYQSKSSKTGNNRYESEYEDEDEYMEERPVKKKATPSKVSNKSNRTDTGRTQEPKINKKKQLNKRGSSVKRKEEMVKPRGKPSVYKEELKQPAFVEKHKVEKVRNTKSQNILLIILIVIGIMFIVGGYIGYSISQKSSPSSKTKTETKQEDVKAQQKLAQEVTEATKYVAIAEGSLLEEDYTRALKEVDSLDDCTEKDNLTKRLEKVKEAITDSDSIAKEEEERQKEVEKEAEEKSKEEEEKKKAEEEAKDNENVNETHSESVNEEPAESTSTSEQQTTTPAPKQSTGNQNQQQTQQQQPQKQTQQQQQPKQQKQKPTGQGKILIVDERGNIYYK